jgi:hypothetical protein
MITTACSVTYCNGACRGFNIKRHVFVQLCLKYEYEKIIIYVMLLLKKKHAILSQTN